MQRRTLKDADYAPPPEAQRLNELAAASVHAWDVEYLPLSIRYDAAKAADAVVNAWYERKQR